MLSTYFGCIGFDHTWDNDFSCHVKSVGLSVHKHHSIIMYIIITVLSFIYNMFNKMKVWCTCIGQFEVTTDTIKEMCVIT